jgi:hypothetical protein
MMNGSELSGQHSSSSSSSSSNKIKSAVDKFSIENILGLKNSNYNDEKSKGTTSNSNENNFQYSQHSTTTTNHVYYRNFLEFNASYGFQGKEKR